MYHRITILETLFGICLGVAISYIWYQMYNLYQLVQL